MSDDLVERVARAIRARAGFSDIGLDLDRVATPIAISVIASIEDAGYVVVPREPTNQMLKASCSAMSEGKRPTPDRVSSKEKHRIRYRAMIDAALEARRDDLRGAKHHVVTAGPAQS